MVLQIELEPETERKLGSEAKRRRIPVEQYARQVLEESLSSRPNGNVLTGDEEERLLDELPDLGRNLPAASTDQTYSREMIYAEHD